MKLSESESSLSGHVLGNAADSGRSTYDDLDALVLVATFKEVVSMNQDATVTVNCQLQLNVVADMRIGSNSLVCQMKETRPERGVPII